MNLRILTVVFTLISTVSAALARERVFVYGQFNGQPVQLVVFPDNRVTLRVAFTPSPILGNPVSHEESLAYLKREVLRITSVGRPLIVDGTGYLLNFQGGNPIWGSSQSIGSVGSNFDNLLFAEGAAIVGNEIRVRGTKTVEGWDGYKFWKPNIPKK